MADKKKQLQNVKLSTEWRDYILTNTKKDIVLELYGKWLPTGETTYCSSRIKEPTYLLVSNFWIATSTCLALVLEIPFMESLYVQNAKCKVKHPFSEAFWILCILPRLSVPAILALPLSIMCFLLSQFLNYALKPSHFIFFRSFPNN